MRHNVRRAAAVAAALAAAGLIAAGCSNDTTDDVTSSAASAASSATDAAKSAMSSATDAAGSAASSATDAASSAMSDASSAATSATDAASSAMSDASSAATSATDAAGAAAGGETKISTPNGEVTVAGPIFTKFTEAGGDTGALGAPTGEPQDGPDGGKSQEFTGGTIAWSEKTGAHVVWGKILEQWTADGGAGGSLGYPTSDETDTADGGKQTTFTGGTITFKDGETQVTPN